MITVTTEVQAVLSSGMAWYADLYTFSLLNGTVIRVTPSDRDVTWGGNTWSSPAQSGAPLIERGDITFEAGLSVDQMQLTVYHDAIGTVSGMSWPAALRVGLFDGATVSLVRAVGAFGQPVAGVIPRFTGKVGPCTPGRMASVITVDSMLAYLRAPVPRNVYQPSCANTVYDHACGLSRAAAETTVTITAVSVDQLSITVSGTLTASRYAGGFARFVGAGANATQQVTVSDNDAHVLTLLYPFPADLVVGQTLAIALGCPKTMAACAAFGGEWKDRFRGHPNVPEPETML